MSNRLALNSVIFSIVSLFLSPASAKISFEPLLAPPVTADITIMVPAASIEVRNFVLTPLAANAAGLKWPLRPEDDSYLVDKIEINFSPESTKQVRKFERVILNFTLDNNMPADEEWSFTLGGMQYIEGHADDLNCIDSEISSDGKTLSLIIKHPAKWQQVDFYYIAKRVNKTTGEVTIFESPDPVIDIRGIKT